MSQFSTFGSMTKTKGPKRCEWGLCNADARRADQPFMDGVVLLPFPKPGRQKLKCERWIQLCNRENFSIERIKPYSYICNKHFIGGNGPTEANPDPFMATPQNSIMQDNRSLRRLAITSSAGMYSNVFIERLNEDENYPITELIFNVDTAPQQMKEEEGYFDLQETDITDTIGQSEEFQSVLTVTKNSEQIFEVESTLPDEAAIEEADMRDDESNSEVILENVVNSTAVIVNEEYKEVKLPEENIQVVLVYEPTESTPDPNLNTPTSNSGETSPSKPFNSAPFKIYTEIGTTHLPTGWSSYLDSNAHFLKIKDKCITMHFEIDSNRSINLFVFNKPINSNNPVLDNIPEIITGTKQVVDVITCLENNFIVCCGNPETMYTTVFHQTPLLKQCQFIWQSNAVHSTQCKLIFQRGRTLRCKHCIYVRERLKKIHQRREKKCPQSTDGQTYNTNNMPLKLVPDHEVRSRLKTQQIKAICLKKQVLKLKLTIKELKMKNEMLEKGAIVLQEHLNSDQSSDINDIYDDDNNEIEF